MEWRALHSCGFRISQGRTQCQSVRSGQADGNHRQMPNYVFSQTQMHLDSMMNVMGQTERHLSHSIDRSEFTDLLFPLVNPIRIWTPRTATITYHHYNSDGKHHGTREFRRKLILNPNQAVTSTDQATRKLPNDGAGDQRERESAEHICYDKHQSGRRASP